MIMKGCKQHPTPAHIRMQDPHVSNKPILQIVQRSFFSEPNAGEHTHIVISSAPAHV